MGSGIDSSDTFVSLPLEPLQQSVNHVCRFNLSRPQTAQLCSRGQIYVSIQRKPNGSKKVISRAFRQADGELIRQPPRYISKWYRYVSRWYRYVSRWYRYVSRWYRQINIAQIGGSDFIYLVL